MPNTYVHKVLNSERNFPLMTERYCTNYPLLTVERYCKWYNIYRINTNGTYEILPFKEYDEYCMWADHSIIPEDFINFAHEKGYKVELQVYDAICRRYIQDALGYNNVFTHEFHEDILENIYRNQTIFSNVFPKDEILQKVLIDEDCTLLN